jgi:hypothetical protein
MLAYDASRRTRSREQPGHSPLVIRNIELDALFQSLELPQGGIANEMQMIIGNGRRTFCGK